MENKKTWVVTAKTAEGEDYREEIEATEEQVKGSIMIAELMTSLTDISYKELSQEDNRPGVAVDSTEGFSQEDNRPEVAKNPLDELLEMVADALSELADDTSSKKQSVGLSTELEGLDIGDNLVNISLKRTADNTLVGGMETHEAFGDLTLEDQRNLIIPFMENLTEELADKLSVSPEDFLK